MFNKQLKRNIKQLDVQIGKLCAELEEIDDADHRAKLKLKKIEELTKVRCQLVDSKVRDSVKQSIIPAVITGGVGITTTLMVLKHEKTDIITSKAWNIATSLFRGK